MHRICSTNELFRLLSSERVFRWLFSLKIFNKLRRALDALGIYSEKNESEEISGRWRRERDIFILLTQIIHLIFFTCYENNYYFEHYLITEDFCKIFYFLFFQTISKNRETLLAFKFAAFFLSKIFSRLSILSRFLPDIQNGREPSRTFYKLLFLRSKFVNEVWRKYDGK